MAAASHRKATREYRKRSTARGLVRLEVQAAETDAALIRALAERLRGNPGQAGALRAKLQDALCDRGVETAFDVFGSELPDEAFAGVFEHDRDKAWPGIDL